MAECRAARDTTRSQGDDLFGRGHTRLLSLSSLAIEPTGLVLSASFDCFLSLSAGKVAELISDDMIYHQLLI